MDSAQKTMDVRARLDQAVLDVSAAWFPANRERLKQIQSSLRAGRYPEDGIALVDDIRKDFALFTYCLRELLLQAQDMGETPPSATSPIEILLWGGIQRLRPMLLVDEKNISLHVLTEATALQAERFLEAMTSATTAELLAGDEQKNRGLAYSAALMRQLGYMLIAWNYPDAYERAFEVVKDAGRFDLAITQVLGFPPNLLALSLARTWGLPEELCAIIAQSRSIASSTTLKTVKMGSDRTAFLCLIGEALARANSPDLYPTATTDWDFACGEIREVLGPTGVDQISKRLSGEYLKDFPKISSAELSLDPARNVAAFTIEETLRLNPEVSHCPVVLRRELEGLYQAILNQRDVRQNLERFVKEVLTTVPWSGGCIYTIDPTRNKLVPRTHFGKTNSNLTTSLDYLPYSTDADIVNRALQAKQPLVDQQPADNSQFILSFAGALGSDEPVGVFYAEAPAELADQVKRQGGELLGTFKALTKALTDCLEMSRME